MFSAEGLGRLSVKTNLHGCWVGTAVDQGRPARSSERVYTPFGKTAGEVITF